MDKQSDRVDEKIMTSLAGQSRSSEVGGTTSRNCHILSPWTLIISSLVILGSLWIAFPDFFRIQIYIATYQPSDWGHIFVVPLIACWFVWLRRDELLARSLRPSWSGIAIVVLGIIIYMVAMMGPKHLIHHLSRSLGVFVVSFGLVILFLGWQSLRVVGFPFIYLFVFGIVISDRIMTPITYELQDLSAKGAWLVLYLAGYDTDLSGNTLTLFENGKAYPLNVAEACSGMRMLVAFLALGTAMAYVGLSRPWQRTLLILLGVPVAIFVNVLRVVTLGLLSKYDSNFAAGDFHTFIGLVWLFPAFIVFIILMWMVRKLVVEPPLAVEPADPDNPPMLRFDRPVIPKVCTVVGLLLISAVTMSYMMVTMNGFLAKKEVALRASLDTIPSSLGTWSQVGEEREYDAAVIESLGTTQFIDRIYAPNGSMDNGYLMLHIAYYSGTIDEVPHIPERCWDAAGLNQMGDSKRLPLLLDESEWVESDTMNRGSGDPYKTTVVIHPVTGVEQVIKLPVGEMELMSSTFSTNQDAEIRRVGGYMFIANGRSCASSFGVRALAFDWTEEYAYYCKVQISAVYKVSVDGDAFIDKYQGDSSDLITNLLPHLMRCLPDWGEIESSGSTNATERVVSNQNTLLQES
jgi:exosortase